MSATLFDVVDLCVIVISRAMLTLCDFCNQFLLAECAVFSQPCSVEGARAMAYSARFRVWAEGQPVRGELRGPSYRFHAVSTCDGRVCGCVTLQRQFSHPCIANPVPLALASVLSDALTSCSLRKAALLAFSSRRSLDKVLEEFRAMAWKAKLETRGLEEVSLSLGGLSF